MSQEEDRRSAIIGAAMLTAIAGGIALTAGNMPTTKPPQIAKTDSGKPAPLTRWHPRKVWTIPRAEPQKQPKALPLDRQDRKAKRRREREQQRETSKPKTRERAASAGMPSCARIRAQYNRMTWEQKMAAYRRATPAQVAHGRKCLGL